MVMAAKYKPLASPDQSLREEVVELTVLSAKLRHPIWMVAGYSSVALLAWIVICIPVSRPLTTKHDELYIPKPDAKTAWSSYGMDDRGENRRLHDCLTEGEDANIVHKSDKRAGVENLEGVQNKAPLLTIALALFGWASYLEKQTSNPSTYRSYIENSAGSQRETALCAYLAPLKFLLAAGESYKLASSSVQECIMLNSGGKDGDMIGLEVADRVYGILIARDPKVVSNMLTAAAFLANQKWLYNGGDRSPLFI
ncbi:hypothetical protein FSARC_11546 [Fusarium sarcochroum]|uniref:Uncharacterized protein n=1 Tax=Fusarium sarcochroum TaxID=1208366 RepID=A0A8H4TET8_9HYPO|nr:hypothetical protein FSARC_11546 [Fusarium sarcochroum]